MPRVPLGITAIAIASVISPAIATTSLDDESPALPYPRTAADQADTRDDAAATQVTLITGDVVSVVGQDAEEPTYVVTPAPGTEGDGTTFSVTGTPDATYIVPSDVADMVGPDAVLDAELFNVERLVAEGLADADSETLPLIVQRADGTEPVGVVGLATAERLDVLGAYSATLDKTATTAVGQSLASADVQTAAAATQRSDRHGDAGHARVLTGAGTNLDGVRRIWLDGVTQAQDWDVNLGQVGAPQLWEAGVTGAGVTVAVLDTGIDAGHLDLAGQVIGSANFSSAPALDDVHGHGTHVAGTIAGTGALAPGVRQGVAPEADLLIGKVLGDDGRGSMSAGIAGMEWAVDNGAAIVNMSLSSAPTDGTDPMSVALNELSRSSGALFVTAAGNEGPYASSVASPSTADLALSVAAVDADGDVASFSSRGPRVGDDGIKPELAAPGVAITAPRSSHMPGDDAPYTTMNGTSMATPHVAGIAALAAQQHSDWDAAQLKSALVSTAAPAAGGVFAVGAGQVSGPAVLDTTLIPDEATIGLAMTDDAPVATEEVVVTNVSDTSITATTAVAGSTDGVLSVTPASLDLEPGASEQITVTVDGSALPSSNTVTGQVRIVPDTGTALSLPVAATRSRWLEVHAVRTTGVGAPQTEVNVLSHGTGDYDAVRTDDDGRAYVSTSRGAVAVTATIREWDENGTEIVSIVSMDVPDGVNEVTVDAATAVPIGAEVRHTTKEAFGLYRVTRHHEEAGTFTYNAMMSGGAFGMIERGSLRVTPTSDQVRPNTLRLDEHWILANRDSDHQAGDASTVYDLVFSSELVPADPIHRLTNGDVKELARQQIDFFAPIEPHRSQFATTATGPDLVGMTLTSPSYVAAPGQQTRYYTAGDVTWKQHAYRAVRAPEGWLRMDLERIAEFAPRQRSTTSFWAGPLGASASLRLNTTEDGSARLNGSFAEMVDAAGNAGQYDDIFYAEPGERTSAILRDGIMIADGLPQDGVDVDPSPAPYTIEQSYRGDDLFVIGGNTATRWETENVGLAGGDGEVALPLLQLRWQAPFLDRSNTVLAGEGVSLRLALSSNALDPAERVIVESAASFTTDGGETWHDLSPRNGRPIAGRWLTIPADALAAGGWIGLRVTARDLAGNTVDQEILRAFPVR